MSVLRDRLAQLAAVVFAAGCQELLAQAPSYSAASIVNAASNQVGPLAPNGLATIYGDNLATGTAALTAGDVVDGMLPYTFSSATSYVLLGAFRAFVLYISPKQINFLVPSDLKPGHYNLAVMRGTIVGPVVQVEIAATSPGLFQLDAYTIIATHLDYTLVSSTSPASPGEIVVLYGTGFGSTDPQPLPGALATEAAPVDDQTQFQVLVAGLQVPPENVYYVGLTPGFAGLYQINLRLPDDAPDDPEIYVVAGAQRSPGGLVLPVRKR